MMLNGILLNDFTQNGTRAAIEFPDIVKDNVALHLSLDRKDFGTSTNNDGVKEQSESRNNKVDIVNLERFDEFEGTVEFKIAIYVIVT